MTSPLGFRSLGSALLALAMAAGATAQDPAPAPAQPSPPSQSAPPFWARPRPSPAADCACDGQQAAAAAPSGRSGSFAVGVASGAALIGLFLLWRRSQRADKEPPARPPLVATPPPPGPGGGLDPRVKARAAPTPATTPAAPATVAAPGKEAEAFEFLDPRNAQIELAQAEPDSESASAQAFYTEIATSLRAALRKEPARQDLRRKLLEIYAASRQVQEFVNLAHEYLNQNRGVRDAFWPQIGAMGVQLAPEHELFQEWAAERKQPAARRVQQLRRFHEHKVDQGKLYSAQQQLVTDFHRLRADKAFQESLRQLLAESVRRPAPLTASPELAYVADGAQIYIKHEDRRRYHDDVMINALGQLLVAQRLGRKRVVTATRDGIAGHAVAGAAAKLGIECTVFITEPDLNRYYGRMLSARRLGAQLRPIPGGTEREPVDPRRHALETWIEDPANTQFVSGLTGGAPPFPEMVRDFLATVGRETADQMKQATGGLPTAVVAGVSDGHLGLGLLQGFLEHTAVQLYCVEEKRPSGTTVETTPEPGTAEVAGTLRTRREHRWLRESGRVSYIVADEQETLRIIEQFHATGDTLFTASARTLAHARALARRMDRRASIVVMLTNQEGADFRSPRIDW